MKIIRNVPSEATIQAELYCALKVAGITAVLEQNFEIGFQRIRVDVLILDSEQNAIAAIEVKNCRNPRALDSFQDTRQFRKYTKLGLPFRYCTTIFEIQDCVEWCSKQLNSNKLKSIFHPSEIPASLSTTNSGCSEP
jgi:hypothetical protein